MKRITLKKQRKGRKLPKGRRSSIAKKAAGSNKAYLRRGARMNDLMPNSSKVGAGLIIARRNLPMNTLHKRNHRTTEMMGPKYVDLSKIK